MIDQFPNLPDNTSVLTANKNAGNRAASASPSKPVVSKRADLEFASANQQLEGFPGTITETVAAHEPDLEVITRDAERFGAQLPAEENLTQPPRFQISPQSDNPSKAA